MSSSAKRETTSCGVCLGSLETGQGFQANFTAECSHSFHFPCISPAMVAAAALCPVCHSPWTRPPSTAFALPFPWPSHSPPEPLHYSDDDPLFDNGISPDSSAVLPKLAIQAIPERPAVAATDSASLFTVLIRLKAPPLPPNARRAPVDLVAVLDVSFSMFGAKLALVKRAAQFVADNLGPSDRLAVVSFAEHAQRVTRLRTMSEAGRNEVRMAISALSAGSGTNIVDGLRKGAQVLEQRRQANPVSGIIFLSDGNDTCHQGSFHRLGYLHLLPVSIHPGNNPAVGDSGPAQTTIPVHTFGFGSDHDPVTMHSISEASGGTFSFVESYEMVQDAFAGCIGGLLSVVAQDARLTVLAASHGVEIRSIPSGRHASGILDGGIRGVVDVGDLYADEEKEFLINLSVPAVVRESDAKTTLLDIACSYKDAASGDTVHVVGDLVEIRRPHSLSITEMMVNLEIDRQKNRVLAAEAITQAQQMAETGDLTGARTLLAKKRGELFASASRQAGDGMCMWLEADMRETEQRMKNERVYQQAGRAFALSGMSAHGRQRATTRGQVVAGQLESFSSRTVADAPAFGGYATPNMATMVLQSQQVRQNEKGS